VAEDLPAARAVHHRDVDPLDIHRGQGRRRVERVGAGDIEMRVPRPAAPAQFAARDGRALLVGVRRDRQPLHVHAHDRVGIGFVFLGFLELRLLPAKELRRVLVVGRVEIAGPQIARLHHVQIAVEDQIAVACHVTPPGWSDKTLTPIDTHGE
jgi:hypothetical protein